MSFDENEMVCFDLEKKIYHISLVLMFIFFLFFACFGAMWLKTKDNEKMRIIIIAGSLFVFIIFFGGVIFLIVRKFI